MMRKQRIGNGKKPEEMVLDGCPVEVLTLRQHARRQSPYRCFKMK
jgi:hypothetical protein